MPLIPLRPLLETVDKYHFAQGAFNVNAVAQAKAAIEVHEMFRSAAILQGADLANGFMGGRTDFQNATLEDKKIGAKNIAAAVKKYAEKCNCNSIDLRVCYENYDAVNLYSSFGFIPTAYELELKLNNPIKAEESA